MKAEKKIHSPDTFILCPFDNGIRAMQQFGRGTYGANKAPAAIYSALNLKVPPKNFIPVDHLNTGKNEDSWKAHEVIESYISGVTHPYILLGGDHSITYPSVKGLLKNAKPGEKYGLIYFDAHYDLRPFEGTTEKVISSGNGFYRILSDPDIPIKPENIVAIGIEPADNEIYKKMESWALSKGITTIYRKEINESNAVEQMKRALEIAGKGTTKIYLSIDMDVLDAEYAPGVSGVSFGGMKLSIMKAMISAGLFCAADVTEVSMREKTWKGEVDTEGETKMLKTAESAAEIIDCIKLLSEPLPH